MCIRDREWAYYNIFVPLAKWTIEDLLPAFLDVLAGCLDVLNSALAVSYTHLDVYKRQGSGRLDKKTYNR